MAKPKTHHFIAIGDLHLTPGPRNEDRLKAFDFAIHDALSRHPTIAAWFLLGDVNHARMTIEDRNALIPRVRQMGESAPVVVLKGNHDVEGDLDFLAHLHTSWPVYVITSPQVLVFKLGHEFSDDFDEHMALFALPFPSKANIVAAGFDHADVGRVASESLDRIFMEAAAQLNDARKDNVLTGMIGHLTVAGAVASSGQPQIGSQLEITEGHLSRLGDCFKVLGHIHCRQRVGSAFYAGSVCRLDWGEVEKKGYLEIIAGLKHPDVGWVEGGGSPHGYEVGFRDIPVPPMFHVEGELSRDGFVWSVKRGPDGPKDDPPESWAGCDIRVRARYAASERDVLQGAKKKIADIFTGARIFQLEPIAVSDHVLRAPEVVHAHTLNDKLQGWAKLSKVSWNGTIVQCADLLQSTEDSDSIVRDVEKRLIGITTILNSL